MIGRLIKGFSLGLLFSTSVLATPIHLGELANFALFAGANGASSQSGYMGLGSESDVHGNIAAKQLEFGAGTIVNGYAAGINQQQGAGIHITQGWQQWNNSQFISLQDQLSALSQQLQGLGGTQTNLQSLNNYTGNGGLNVFSLNPVIMAHQAINLFGSADDTFVFNISQWFMMDGGGIFLHGINPNQVFFNFHSQNQASEYTTLSAGMFGTSNIQGNLLAPNMFLQVGDGATLNNTRILAGALQLNIQTLIPPPTAQEPSQVPVPASMLLLLPGLLLLTKRKRSN